MNSLKNKKRFSLLCCIAGLFLFTSCGNNGNNGNKTIEEAINENDFATARMLQKEKAHKINEERGRGLFLTHNKRCALDEEERLNYIDLKKINRAEITYFIKQQDLVRAKTIANENNYVDEYNKLVIEQLDLWIQDGKFDLALNILYAWVFKEDPVWYVSSCYRYHIDNYNKEYNSEIDTYNDYVFKLFYKAVSQNNVDVLKKVVILFQDNLVEASRKLIKRNKDGDSGYDLFDITYKKQNNAKTEALKKLEEVGIKLN